LATNGLDADFVLAAPLPGCDERGRSLTPPEDRRGTLIKMQGHGDIGGMLADAQRLQLMHNRNDHSECTAASCFWTAERERLGLSSK